MKKTIFLTSLVLVASAGFLMAGGNTESAAQPAQAAPAAKAAEPVEISMAYPVAVDAPIAQMMNGFAQDFMAANPTIKVKMVYSGGYTDVRTAVQTAIQGKAEAPELAVMLAADIYDLINAHFVESFDSVIAASKDAQSVVADIEPSFLGNSYYKGALYGLPFQRSAVVLYYNADLLAQAGLGVPKSWDELASAAKALTVDGGKTRWGIEIPTEWPYWVFQPFAIGGGKNIFTDDVTVNFNAPEVVDAIRFYNSLSAGYGATPAGVQASWGSSTGNFAAGKTAMIIHSSGSLSSILKNASFKVGVMAVPGKKPGTLASVPGGGNIYLTAGHSDAEKAAALSFALFLLDPARVASFAQATGYIPYRKAALAVPSWKEYVAKVPQAEALAAAMTSAGAELSTQALAEVRTVFHKHLQAAFNGQEDPQAAMDAAQAEADKILSDYR